MSFLGAAGTVTGSRFLVDTPVARVLVDCGLYQGLKELRARNWQPFPVPPDSIDAVVLTHAHVDHSGYLPGLVAGGFRGPIFCTRGTAALCAVVLPDAGHLQEEEASYANRKGYSKHSPARALFTEADARECLPLLRPIHHGTVTEVATGVRIVLQRAGHILGSATVRLRIDGGPVLAFSGDLGRQEHPFLLPPAPLEPADAVVMESTYGNREHDPHDGVTAFADAITATARRGGTVVIPSFAVDRTEVLLFHLRELIHAGAVPELPIYVDSPMALAALGHYRDAIANTSPEIRPHVRGHPEVLEPPGLHEVHAAEDSKRLHGQHYPSIIISASGMATGGRVLHHLANRLPDSRNTVILPGFQAEATRGRSLVDGARHLKMLGRYIPVAAEIVHLPQFSVHAGRSELLAWLRTSVPPPAAVYVVHGEPAASEALSGAIADELGLLSVVPKLGERVRLT
jgi:metallo-beta-lactamase family protein